MAERRMPAKSKLTTRARDFRRAVRGNGGRTTTVRVPSRGSGAPVFKPGITLTPSRIVDMRGQKARPMSPLQEWLMSAGMIAHQAGRMYGGDARLRAGLEKLSRMDRKPATNVRPANRPMTIQDVPGGGKGVAVSKGHSRKSRRPQIQGGAPIPAGALSAAITVARSVASRMKGSPITGPTKLSRMSQAASGPVVGLKRPKRPTTSRRGGSGGTRAS